MRSWVRLWLVLALVTVLFWVLLGQTPASPINVMAAPAPLPPKGMTAFVVALVEHPMLLPTEFAEGAVARIGCESSWNPKAVNPLTGTTGWMQIDPIWEWLVIEMGYTWADMKNPRANLDVARAIWQMEGWSPWACKGE